MWVLTGTLYCQQASSFGWDVKPRSLKIPGCFSKRVSGVTLASWTNLPIGLWSSWPPNNPHICWLASSLCLLSTSKLVCGGRSSALWLPSHHPGGCCTLVVDEEIPPDNVECFECLEKAEKHYINVMKYYYCYFVGWNVFSVSCMVKCNCCSFSDY